jgi:hypothetical protein
MYYQVHLALDEPFEGCDFLTWIRVVTTPTWTITNPIGPPAGMSGSPHFSRLVTGSRVGSPGTESHIRCISKFASFNPVGMSTTGRIIGAYLPAVYLYTNVQAGLTVVISQLMRSIRYLDQVNAKHVAAIAVTEQSSAHLGVAGTFSSLPAN